MHDFEMVAALLSKLKTETCYFLVSLALSPLSVHLYTAVLSDCGLTERFARLRIELIDFFCHFQFSFPFLAQKK